MLVTVIQKEQVPTECPLASALTAVRNDAQWEFGNDQGHCQKIKNSHSPGLLQQWVLKACKRSFVRDFLQNWSHFVRITYLSNTGGNAFDGENR